jgi:hypothetical protein
MPGDDARAAAAAAVREDVATAWACRKIASRNPLGAAASASGAWRKACVSHASRSGSSFVPSGGFGA